MYNFTTQAKLIKSRKINENSFRRLPTSAAVAGGKSRSSAGNGGGGWKILIEKNRNLIRKIFSDLRRRSAGLLDDVQICQNAGGIVSCTSPTSGLRRLRGIARKGLSGYLPRGLNILAAVGKAGRTLGVLYAECNCSRQNSASTVIADCRCS